MLLTVNKTLPLKRGEVFHYVQDAADAAKPGDTVVIDAGEYKESVEANVSGNETAFIKFYFRRGSLMIGEKGYRPVIDIRGKSYLYIQNMVSRDGRNGVSIEDDRSGKPSQHIVVDHCNISLSRSSGIRVRKSYGIAVQFNVVHKTNIGGVHEMISIIGTDRFLVHGNEVFNGAWMDERGNPVEGKEGIDIKDGSRNGTVESNNVHDLTRLGIYVDAWDETTHTIIVRNNRVNNCKQGIALASEDGGLLKNVLVENNTLSNNAMYGVIVPDWVGDGQREDIKILNNTLINNREGPLAVTTSNITGLVVSNNVVISSDEKVSTKCKGGVFDRGVFKEENTTVIVGEA